MSIAISDVEIEYPESDGKPMAETEWHIEAIIRMRSMLKHRYLNKQVYIGSDLLVYYTKGNPKDSIAPDVFAAFDCDPKARGIFKVWEEQRVPDVVFEFTSRSTASEDKHNKPNLYAQIGVKELFLFDPTGEFLSPQLQGFRFAQGKPLPMEPHNGQFFSDILNVHLSSIADSLSVNQSRLRLIDATTGEEVLTGEESERHAKEEERHSKEKERRAKEEERRAKEEERRAKEDEREKRIAAEKLVEQLQAELNHLRKQMKG